MTWRGTTDFKDRFFSMLVYTLPLIYILPYGATVLREIPPLAIIYQIISPLTNLFYTLQFSLPFAGLIIFFGLWLGVVRNRNISHFIRFNTMQAILLDILIILFGIVLQLLVGIISGGFLLTTLNSMIFLGVFAACLYSIVQSALGSYAELPTISEAAYSQVR